MNNPDRYARQTILPEIGRHGQKKISGSSVLCIGAGGLGSPALLYLAAAGVGRIGIVDFDTVDETNLQRQIIFGTDQTGQNKAVAAGRRLKSLNPEIKADIYPEKLTGTNAETLFSSYDVIIDGTDNFAAKFLINDTAVKTDKPFIYGSVLGFEGQLAVFNDKDGPCYRCLFPERPAQHIPNCADAGVIGAVAGLIGTAQAMEAIKLIVGHESFKPLSGKLWILDTRTMDNRILELHKSPECTVCSQPKEAIMLPEDSNISEIEPEEAQKCTADLFIDVRELDEWDAGHIEEARHLPLSQLMEGNIPTLPKDQTLIIYCKKGKRGESACQILKARGYTNIKNMTGGYDAWCVKCR